MPWYIYADRLPFGSESPTDAASLKLYIASSDETQTRVAEVRQEAGQSEGGRRGSSRTWLLPVQLQQMSG